MRAPCVHRAHTAHIMCRVLEQTLVNSPVSGPQKILYLSPVCPCDWVLLCFSCHPPPPWRDDDSPPHLGGRDCHQVTPPPPKTPPQTKHLLAHTVQKSCLVTCLALAAKGS